MAASPYDVLRRTGLSPLAIALFSPSETKVQSQCSGCSYSYLGENKPATLDLLASSPCRGRKGRGCGAPASLVGLARTWFGENKSAALDFSASSPPEQSPRRIDTTQCIVLCVGEKSANAGVRTCRCRRPTGRHRRIINLIRLILQLHTHIPLQVVTMTAELQADSKPTAPGPQLQNFRPMVQDTSGDQNQFFPQAALPAQAQNSYAQNAGFQGYEQQPQQLLPQPPQAEEREAPVPIPRLPQVAKSSGPVTKPIIMPPRAKPGRKPMAADDQTDRRRMQNRQAQRNFRDKRVQKLATTQEELAAVRKQRDRDAKDAERKLEVLHELRQKDQETIRQLRQRMMELEGKDSFSGPSFSTTGPGSMSTPQMLNYRVPRAQGPYREDPATLTPPEVNFQDQETDFTHMGRAARQASATNNEPSPSGDSTLADYGSPRQPGDGTCGFCTDPSNCVCKQQSSSCDDNQSAPQPGNCDGCLADPEQARLCRQFAESAGDPSAFRGNDPAESTISCEQFMHRIMQSGQPYDSLSQLSGNQIHARPSTDGRYEVDEREAARALQSLSSRRNGRKG